MSPRSPFMRWQASTLRGLSRSKGTIYLMHLRCSGILFRLLSRANPPSRGASEVVLYVLLQHLDGYGLAVTKSPTLVSEVANGWGDVPVGWQGFSHEAIRLSVGLGAPDPHQQLQQCPSQFVSLLAGMGLGVVA